MIDKAKRVYASNIGFGSYLSNPGKFSDKMSMGNQQNLKFMQQL